MLCSRYAKRYTTVCMIIFDAIILGIIEGATEFLPVSSTGHLIVAERLLGIYQPSLFFNTVIQLGAIFAAVIYLRKRIVELFRDLFVAYRRNKPLLFLLATVPVLVIGFVFHSTIERLQGSVTVVGVMSILIALLFAWGERRYKKSLREGTANTTQNKLGWKEFLTIGLWQSLSVIPGVSRSGITVFGGITQKLSFKDATEIAFLLAIPAMSAASGYEFLKVYRAGLDLSSNLMQTTAVGFIVSFVVALATISITLPLLKRFGFTPFVIYRIAMGILLLIFLR